jgi:hypothetical protein
MMADTETVGVFDKMVGSDIASAQEFPGMFISGTTLSDRGSFDGRFHALEVVTFIDRKSFAHFEDKKNQRSKKYEDFKEALSLKMLKSVEKVVPGISEKIVKRELGTPMTNEHYINSTDGSVYGTEKSFKQTGPFAYKADTEIENLYMCGASIISHGVAGAAYSGVQTAAAILGCRQEDLIKKDPEQNIRVYSAEDHKDYPEWMLSKIKVKEDRVGSSLKDLIKED